MKNVILLSLTFLLFACSDQENQEASPQVPGESYHIQANKIPQNPDSGFTNVYNKGGMSIGYVEVSSSTDFSPLLKGLPNDMCISPHWGYIIEGSIRLIYADGKEETVSAGEVFYWPEPHTAIIDDSVKLVDFSPDEQFIPLMKHIGSVMSESQE